MSNTVTVRTSVTYRAFQTPNFATMDMPAGLKQDGFRELPKTAIGDLAPEVLDALAAQWLDHLYAGLGRETPFRKVGL